MVLWIVYEFVSLVWIGAVAKALVVALPAFGSDRRLPPEISKVTGVNDVSFQALTPDELGVHHPYF